jgi:hypothetical protein
MMNMSGQTVVILISGLVTLLIVSWVHRSVYSNDVLIATSRDRLYRAYAPLFQIIEPKLYKEITNKDAAEIGERLLAVAQRESVHIAPLLYKRIREFTQKAQKSAMLSYKEYEAICYDIETEYEELKRILKFPRRDIVYRSRHEEQPQLLKRAPVLFKAVALCAGVALIFIAVYYCVQALGQGAAAVIALVKEFI